MIRTLFAVAAILLASLAALPDYRLDAYIGACSTDAECEAMFGPMDEDEGPLSDLPLTLTEG